MHEGGGVIVSDYPSPRSHVLPHSHSLCSEGTGRECNFLEIESVDPDSPESSIERLYEVLAALHHQSDVCYLIIDGYDRLGPLSQARLQEHLGSTESQALRVLLLSAISDLVLYPPIDHISCDVCGRGEDEQEGLQIYWTCELCPCDLCDTCKAEGRHCDDSQHLMSEPYNVVDMKLKSVPSELRQFVRMDLEAEYGGKVADNVVEAVYDPSDGNVNISKLRLDQIRDFSAPQDILSASDRLPREIVAFFDTEIKHISVLESQQRDQTLLAMIAVAASDWISVRRLEEILNRIGPSKPDGGQGEYIHVRQVLRSARGLLSSFIFRGSIASGQQDSDRHRIGLYVRDLGWYIREDYNQDLVLVKQYFNEAQTREGDFSPSQSFKRSLDTRKKSGSLYKSTPAEVQGTRKRATQHSTRNIIDAIIQEPGDLCTLCRQSFFQSHSNSGERCWSDQYSEKKCRICLYAFGKMKSMTQNPMQFQWARRTMGRTSDSDQCLVLTLRNDSLHAQAMFQRFVFMLRSEVGCFLESKHLGKSTALEYSGDRITEWLNICQTQHTHCTHTNTNSYVPKRLVDIDAGGLEPFRVIKREEKLKG